MNENMNETPHFYLFSMKTSTLTEINHLETFQILGKTIWL